jgi:hypothetical protein
MSRTKVMKTIRHIIYGLILGVTISVAFQAHAGIASFKADLLTAVQSNFLAADRARIANAFASAYGYQATINGQPNPQTKGDFAADQLVNYVKNIVLSEEAKAAVVAVPTPTPLPN